MMLQVNMLTQSNFLKKKRLTAGLQKCFKMFCLVLWQYVVLAKKNEKMQDQVWGVLEQLRVRSAVEGEVSYLLFPVNIFSML